MTRGSCPSSCPSCCSPLGLHPCGRGACAAQQRQLPGCTCPRAAGAAVRPVGAPAARHAVPGVEGGLQTSNRQPPRLSSGIVLVQGGGARARACKQHPVHGTPPGHGPPAGDQALGRSGPAASGCEGPGASERGGGAAECPVPHAGLRGREKRSNVKEGQVLPGLRVQPVTVVIAFDATQRWRSSVTRADVFVDCEQAPGQAFAGVGDTTRWASWWALDGPDTADSLSSLRQGSAGAHGGGTVRGSLRPGDIPRIV